MTAVAASPFTDRAAAHWIGGARLEEGPVLLSTDPATDQPLGAFHDGGRDTAVAAVAAARAAFRGSSWRTDRELRSRALWALADAVEAQLERLATAITLENGKPLGQARFELSIAAPKLRYYAGLALTDLGSAATSRTGAVSMLLKEPVGVAGIIVPWNSPVVLAVRSLAPALAAGCTAVVKMPAQTALTAALLSEVLAGVPALPAGVVNVFTESGDAGAKELVASRDVAVISYTGSSAVGSRIMAAAAPQLKRVSLELGGKAPVIVFDDADLEVALPALTGAATTFAGQFCMTGSRVLVQRSVADRVRDGLVLALGSLRLGPGTEAATQLGPLVDHAAVDRVEALVAAAEATDGVEVLLRGGPTEGPGAFFRPAVIAVQDVSSPLVQEEVFGPVVTLEVFDTEDEAVERANATDYGLAASVWTRDGARSLRVSAAVEAGTVWTNDWAQILDQFEEGGYKRSGLGRLNGPGGLAEFQEVKHVYRAV